MIYREPNYEKRVYGLDVYRAIAILIVVAGHGLIPARGLFDARPRIPVIDGVELFFVLSGFLIGSILIKTIEKTGGLNFSTLNRFWKRRWFRTLPNYYLILFVNVLLVKYGIIDGDIETFSYKFVLFLQNLHEGFVGFFWESWSLSIEEWFYISMPFCILISLRLLPRKKALLLTIIIMLATPLIYRISISDSQVDLFWWDVNFRKVIITRLDAIIYGVLGAYIKFYHPNWWEKSPKGVFAFGILIIYANILIPEDHNSFYMKTVFFSVTPFGAALLLPYADSIKSFTNRITGKVITYISVISYSMYLVNLAIVAQVIEKNFPPESTGEKIAAYLGFWAAVLIISTLLYTFYEKPFIDMRERFKSSSEKERISKP